MTATTPVDRASSDAAAATQAEVSAEIAEIAAAYAASGSTETGPRLDYEPYRSSVLRHPTKDPHHADPEHALSSRPGVNPHVPIYFSCLSLVSCHRTNTSTRRQPARMPPVCIHC